MGVITQNTYLQRFQSSSCSPPNQAPFVHRTLVLFSAAMYALRQYLARENIFLCGYVCVYGMRHQPHLDIGSTVCRGRFKVARGPNKKQRTLLFFHNLVGRKRLKLSPYTPPGTPTTSKRKPSSRWSSGIQLGSVVSQNRIGPIPVHERPRPFGADNQV